MDLKEVLSEVAQIAENVVSSGDSQAPVILVELKDLYQQCPRASLQTLKLHVWHYGLVHILIELLGQNFSAVDGHWTTAAELASILSHSLTGLQPEKLNKVVKLDSSQIEEYYDGVLPTALHSLLVLANNLLTVNTQLFSGVLDSITMLCSYHHILAPPLVQSPYLLHMLTSGSDDSSFHLLLSVLKKMLSTSISSDVLANLPLEVVLNYTDELVQRIVSSSKPFVPLEVFGMFLQSSNVADSVKNRYPGLKQFLFSLLQVDNETVNIKWIMERLGGDLDHAATVIQAHWRGHCARKRVMAIHRGIVAFQRLFRKARAKRSLEEKSKCDLNAEYLEQENQQIAFRTFHEKQFKIIEQLPAKEVGSFLTNLQENSAMKIQRWWRDHRVEKTKTAKKKTSDRPKWQDGTAQGKRSVLLSIDSKLREKFQDEISQYHKQRPVVHRSWTSLQQLHSGMQQQLQTMYLDRTLENERSRKRRLLLNQLEVDSGLLFGAPALEKAQAGTIKQFTGSACGITYMAQLAHEEELKSIELPWWKRTNFDIEEIDLDS